MSRDAALFLEFRLCSCISEPTEITTVCARCALSLSLFLHPLRIASWGLFAGPLDKHGQEQEHSGVDFDMEEVQD